MSSSDQLYQRIAPDVKLGQRVKIFAFTNLYGCEIGDDVKIGTPYLAGAKVSFEVVRHLRDEKDISFFFRKRKDVRKTIGHRQDLTALKVSKISA